MDLRNKKILVTGADGFIGSHLTEKLVEKGYRVKAFVFYNSFNSWGWLDHSSRQIRDNLEIFAGDIRDPFGVDNAASDCDVIFHLAALIAIPYSYHSPATYVDTNINGTLNILQAAKKHGVEKLIHTSTSEVYGTAQFVPITEDHPLSGQSPYSASKIGADQMAWSFYTSFDTPVVTIRPFNTYGPRQSLRAVIPTLITQMANDPSQVKLGSLTPTRDFNYVGDITDAFIKVAESDRTVGTVVNAGSNFEISIADTAQAIAELMDVEISIQSESQRMRPEKSEVNRLWADNSKIKAFTDWTPRYSGIEGFKKGLQHCIEWYKEPNNLKLFKTDQYNI
ncbi:NAD-dependent 4,6-dehydratase LegB [uncultured Desulfobacter sp.]|uniref:NAD-dependent 4,6-dehydratase LegB n=1 Tax=uncultured Desulfobacter sp. TaxID=240139 RepID=UPI0029C885DE|nr:NAD-dependent 4,6-dehydratase LegB [uncultured Desulfobacter sp.]